jgi:hypothetical protein
LQDPVSPRSGANYWLRLLTATAGAAARPMADPSAESFGKNNVPLRRNFR